MSDSDEGADSRQPEIETSESLVYASLDEALAEREMPKGNYALIHKVCDNLGIVRFEGRASYIKAVRPDGGRALNITHGWTNGFTSEDEARRATGGAKVWPSDRGRGLWGVHHPMYNQRSEKSGAVRQYETCPKCFLVMSASGVCDNCNS